MTCSCKRVAHAGNGHEAFITILEGADTGQDNAFGLAHNIGVSGHDDLPAGARRALESFQGGVQVAGTIIDNCHLHGIQLLEPKRPSTSWLTGIGDVSARSISPIGIEAQFGFFHAAAIAQANFRISCAA